MVNGEVFYVRDQREPAAARQFAVLFGVTVVLGETITPDLSNADTRLYEWSDVERDGLT